VEEKNEIQNIKWLGKDLVEDRDDKGICKYMAILLSTIIKTIHICAKNLNST
jgi:hypothetical protein